MKTVINIRPTNLLAASPHYESILTEYNLRLARDGRVNAGKFHQEVIAPLMPQYSTAAWYAFLRRFKEAGSIQVGIQSLIQSQKAEITPGEALQEKSLMSNTAATSKLVSTLLNVSAARAAELALHPEMLTHKEAIELGLKTMKAQDSRIHAIGKIREDNREQDKFDRAFSEASNG